MKIWTITTSQADDGTATAVYLREADAIAHRARIVAASWASWFGRDAAPLPDDMAEAWGTLTNQAGFMDTLTLQEHDVDLNAGDDPDVLAAYRAAARELHQDDGTCEIDDGATVSMGDDPGAYVQAWVWVPNAEAGLHDCDGCGIRFVEGDDSYCGTCPDCADKAEKVDACEQCGNTLNDGSDICDQCGGKFA
jgi:hypothetical protein